MKTLLCLMLVIGLSVPGCSRFTKTGRMDRAYYKQIKQAKVAREKRRKNLISRQRAQEPSLRETPPPLQQNVVESAPESQ